MLPFVEKGKLTVYIDVSKSVVSQLQTFGELGGGHSSHLDVHKSFLYSKPFVEKAQGDRSPVSPLEWAHQLRLLPAC